MDFFGDLKFWAIVISVVSLAFSTYPTIRNWWKGKMLQIEPQDAVALSHRWGYTNINWALTLINSGGVTIRIKKIYIVLKKDGKSLTIPARNFFRTTDAKTSSLYSSITLKPGDEANHVFCFFHKLPRSEDKAIREIISQANQEFSQPIQSSTSNSFTVLEPRKLSETTISKIDAIFKTNFHLTCGEYEISVYAKDENNKDIASITSRFTIFESDERDLRSITERYSSGDGVTYHSEQNTWFFMNLTDIQ
ncbi:hypothetical protein CCX46_09065 [Pseudomonas sp. RU47]|uniref:hypothetical protein n=1 Tax=Pseudomonas sp. RU47 TaxID=2005388 RepID=UPI000FDE2B40|nr:hypothetical protein [Pseudomonas sp. RU47]AZZ75293.1 hypothetical protein CCX46_09065 [Pseudomonas sp. RU47]